MRKSLLIIILLIVITGFKTTGQTIDSLLLPVDRDTIKTISIRKAPPVKQPLYKQMIIPAFLTSYGFFAIDNDRLQALDHHIKEEVWTEHPHHLIKIDDYLQYAPGITVYGLNAMGIKGKNNFLDRTLLYLLSSTLMAITVQSLKRITRIERPDSSGTKAFPSGHTATAFVAAEFLYQEYKDRSPWYGIAGYTVAASVGYIRIYNNRHWLKDVVAGAGIGLGITKFVYWLYPKIRKKISRSHSPSPLFN